MIENYINNVYKNVNLKDGKQVIKNILLTLFFKDGISNKELARMNLLPIPIVVAIKKEFIKFKIIKQDRGIRLTSEGKSLVGEHFGYLGLDLVLYQKLMDKPFDYNLINQLQEVMTEIFENRPLADVTIDQTKCTIETAIKRAILCLYKGQLLGNKILCVGDDDLVSVALGFLLKFLYKDMKDCKTKLFVVDIDCRIINYINHIAKKHNLPINTKYHDLRDPFLDEYMNQFDCVFTDPPYTLNGLNVFLSRSVSALKNEGNLTIFLSYSHKPADFCHDMQKNILSMGLLISEIIPSFNTYEGAGIIGNKGQMIILKSTTHTNSLINTSFVEPIYTGDFKNSIKVYKCKTCNREYEIGKFKPFKTIESLKTNGCHYCKQHSFIIKK